MNKFIPLTAAALFALATVGAQAASHAGGAPMKASEAAAKKEDKKPETKKDEKKDQKK